jgi:hypothetical protein
VGLQRVGDLPEVLGARAAERGDHLAQLGELGAHLGVDLVEPGVDQPLALIEVGGSRQPGLLGGRRHLFTVQHGRLLEGRGDRRITFGCRLLAGGGHCVLHRHRQLLAQRVAGARVFIAQSGVRGLGAPHGDHPGAERCSQCSEDHDGDVHAFHHEPGVSHRSRIPGTGSQARSVDHAGLEDCAAAQRALTNVSRSPSARPTGITCGRD